jgi:hypothetical protein
MGYAASVSRSTWILLAIAALALCLTLVLLCRRAREAPVVAASASPTDGAFDPLGAAARPPPGASADRPSGALAAPLSETIHDRKVRDQVRERIVASGPDLGVLRNAGTTGSDSPAAASSAEKLDATYVREVIRSDFAPMAKQCYESALASNPELGGKLVVFFTIVGDDKVGGVVESAHIDEGTTLQDAKLQQCFTESMMTVAFKAPPKRGAVSVRYPFMLSPDGPDAGS